MNLNQFSKELMIKSSNIKLVKWLPHKRPPLGACPEEFCFFWHEQGSSFATGVYKNVEEALQSTQPVLKSFCGCSFGKCKRQENDRAGLHDWYEPVEPELEAYGLPWFYFMNPEKLTFWKRLIYKFYFFKG